MNNRVVFLRKTFTLTEQQEALSVESGLVAEEVLRGTQYNSSGRYKPKLADIPSL